MTALLRLLPLYALVLLTMCADLERNNPLDPKNPDSFRKQVVLAELFVNDSVFAEPVYDTTFTVVDTAGETLFVDSVTVIHTVLDLAIDTTIHLYPASGYAESALADIYLEYGADRFIFVEYHIGSSHLADPFITDLNRTYYSNYVQLNGSIPPEGVPDIFINGPETRLSGGNSVADLKTRLRTVLADAADRVSHFTLEGSAVLTDQIITARAKLARLGSEDASGLFVQYIFTRKADAGHPFIVLENETDNIPVSTIGAGEVIDIGSRSITLPDSTLSEEDINVIIYLKDQDDMILQSLLIGILN